MNIKAERIEQLIQIVNRNLLLIYSGQKAGVTPIDTRRLQRVDAAVFDGDKFAFEMVHFVKSSRDEGDGSVTALWDRNFTKGLETLLVECAMVHDDIERDCFVSRVYCWFTEKLTERRDLPRQVMGRAEMKELRSSLMTMNMDATHTIKGLEKFASQDNGKSVASALEDSSSPGKEEPEVDVIKMPLQRVNFGNRKLPIYVKHAYPNLHIGGKSEYEGFLPKVPGAEDNYGMVYHKPETDAERQMHELWLARRQQEAFNWKSQQHMALVMDRLALHKARLESDSLRRQESNSLLKARQAGGIASRPFSADQVNNSRFSGQTHRPQSKGDIRKSASLRGFVAADSPENSPERKNNDFAAKTISVTLNDRGIELDSEVQRPARSTISKNLNKERKDIKHIPMRYKLDAPEAFTADYATNQFYMQLSDSDDDDKPEREIKGVVKKAAAGGGGKKGAKDVGKNAGVAVKFKREKPIARERPVSAAKFRDVSTNDSELKVHYRHTNYRRMPMTDEQTAWLEEREGEREKKSLEVAAKLLEAAEASGKADKGKKDAPKKDEKKDAKKKTAEPEVEVKKCKYKNATHFMTSRYPTFDPDDNGDSQGPMRMMQLVECARIMGAMTDFGMEGAVSERAVRNALVIPQDMPEAISLENMRENQTEGLMMNPVPREFWRQTNFKSAAKKGGGKKKK